ncbi:hypothetical protein [Ekhidna sp. To15]|uniref:hypothetical protein n=1 Tax=Ekhidna sp. To15 TaxID=3395267 RepID=UPI003F51B80A
MQYRAICTTCNWEGPWRDTKGKANQDRLNFQLENPNEQTDIEVKQTMRESHVIAQIESFVRINDSDPSPGTVHAMPIEDVFPNDEKKKKFSNAFEQEHNTTGVQKAINESANIDDLVNRLAKLST